MSLSDATVLTFLSPTVTAAFGYLFLREAVSWKQGVAGRRSPLSHHDLNTDGSLLVVVSLFGVVLIARPTSMFGGSERTDAGAGAGGPMVTEFQRMIAVGYVLPPSSLFWDSDMNISVSLIGVLGASSACTYSVVPCVLPSLKRNYLCRRFNSHYWEACTPDAYHVLLLSLVCSCICSCDDCHTYPMGNANSLGMVGYVDNRWNLWFFCAGLFVFYVR